MQPFTQGWLDSMCGIYSIVNAERFLNKSTEDESQKLFNDIITFLAKKRKLKDIMIDGVNHKMMSLLVETFFSDKFTEVLANKKGFSNLKEWWNYTRGFMDMGNRAIILSLGGKRDHLTVIESMSERAMRLLDSNWTKAIKRSECRMLNPNKDDPKDRYTIYPYQCWYITK